MDDGLLKEQVEKFRHLYDKRSNLFKNKLARENAWKTIGHILETEAEQCEQRWNVLRNKYAALKRRKVPSGSQAFTLSWPYFDAMKFLDPFTLTRVRRISSLKQKNTQSSNQSDLWSGMYDIVENVQEDLDVSQDRDSADEELENILPSSQASNSIQTPLPTPSQTRLLRTSLQKRKNSEDGESSRKKKPENVAESVSVAFSSITKTVNSYVAKKGAIRQDIDLSDKLFAESIAADLSKVKKITDKIFIKQQIYSLLHEYSMRVDIENQ